MTPSFASLHRASVLSLAVWTAFVATALAAPVSPQRAPQRSPQDVVADAVVAAHTPANDDPQSRVTTLLDVVAANAHHPASALLLREVADGLDELTRFEAVEAAIARCRAQSLHGSVRAALNAAERRLHGLRGDVEAAARIVEPTEVVAVLAVGPFGGEGDHWLGREFAPEHEFDDADRTFAGRFGLVRPRVVERARIGGALRLAAEGPENAGCHYALVQIDAERAVAAHVSVMVPGSCEVFVNGRRIGIVDRVARPSLPTSTFGCVLRRGRNHVLVKTTTNDAADIAVAVHDDQGDPVSGATFAPPTPIVAVAPRADDEPSPPAPYLSPYRALTASSHDGTAASPTAKLAAALAYLRISDDPIGLRMLHELDGHAFADPAHSLAFALAYGWATQVPAELRRAKVSAALARAESLGDHATLRLAQVRRLQESDRVEDGIRTLRTAIDAGHDGPATRLRLHELLGAMRLHGDQRRLCREWSTKRPADLLPHVLAAREAHAGGDTRAALDALRPLIDAVPGHPAVFEFGLQLAIDAADDATIERLATVANAAGAPGDARAARLALGVAVRRDRGQAEAARALAALPQATAADLRRAGDVLLASGDDDAARTAYAASLERRGAHDLRRLLGRLAGTPEDDAVARFALDGDAQIAAFTATDREQTAGATLVVDQRIVTVETDGSWVARVHELRRINDQAGVETWQEAKGAARADEVLLLRTVTPDGRSYVPNRVASTFGMPRLAPGCFVESIHRNHGRAPAPGPWRLPSFVFQSADEPFVHSEFVVVLPREHAGRFRLRNFAGIGETIPLDDGRVAHRFVSNHAARLPDEHLRPPDSALVPTVAYGQDGDLDAIAREARARFRYEARATPWTDAQARDLTAGLDSDTAKVEAIHRFVHGEIPSAEGASDATSVLLLRRGPRLVLAAALLEAAGVRFTPTLAHETAPEFDEDPVTTFVDERPPPVPMLRVEPADGPAQFWAIDDPRHAPLGAIADTRRGAIALLLHDSGIETIRLPGAPDPRESGIAVRGTIRLDADGDAVMTATISIGGFTGLEGKDQLRQQPDNVRQVFARQFAGEWFGGWSLRSSRVVDLASIDGALTVEVEAVQAGWLRPTGERFRMTHPLPGGRHLQSLGDRLPRTLPVQLTSSFALECEFVVDPGPAFRIVGLPRSAAMPDPAFDWWQTVARDGERIVWRRGFTQRPGRIEAGAFHGWLDHLRAIDELELQPAQLVRRQ
jgi:hypothetical protein